MKLGGRLSGWGRADAEARCMPHMECMPHMDKATESTSSIGTTEVNLKEKVYSSNKTHK